MRLVGLREWRREGRDQEFLESEGERGEQLGTCLGLLIINRVDLELSLLRCHG